MMNDYEKQQRDQFDGDAIYPVQGMNVWALIAIKTRLYNEKRLTGDDMRDMAHIIDRIIEDAEIYGSMEV